MGGWRFRVTVVALACALALGAAGCAPTATPQRSGVPPAPQPAGGKMPAGSARLTDADSGATVDLTVGGALVIDLEENASTGYLWQVDGTVPDVLGPVSDSAKASEDTSVVGASGRRILEYAAVKAGEAELKLVYVRSWEKDVAPAKTFTVNVVVR